MNIAEELDKIALETIEGANKQAELVNMTFTLVGAELVNYEYQGEKRESYIGTVSMDGKEDRYWLSGSILRRQIDWLMANGKLPVRVKLIRDADRNGSPYVLKAMEPVRELSANGAVSDKELIRQAIDRVGVDEVAIALGEDESLIQVDDDGVFTLQLKGVSLVKAKAIRDKLTELIAG